MTKEIVIVKTSGGRDIPAPLGFKVKDKNQFEKEVKSFWDKKLKELDYKPE